MNMTLIALTGTPGVGKSTVSELLRKKYQVIDIHKFAKDNGLFEDFDKEMGSYDVDTDKLSVALQPFRGVNGFVFLDGHLAHFVDCDEIVVMRCDPEVIDKRLKERGYDEAKVKENVQAEVLDVILCESVDTGRPVFEFDCTGLTVEQTAERIEDIIIRGKKDGCAPGSVNWSGEMERWF